MKAEQILRHRARIGFETHDPAQMVGLSDAQRDAIARVIVAHGPALIRQGSTQRLLGTGALGGALAAAASLVFMLQAREPDTKTELPALVVAASCAADAPVTPITHEHEDRSSIQIGSRIRAVSAGTTRLSIVEAAPCVTRLALNEGTLTLQAQDLGGGTLWVDTPHGVVRAAGTVMRIVTLASSTSISVVEGEAVVRSLHGAERVDAGRAVTVDHEGVERLALSGQERRDLLGAFDEPAQALEKLSQDAGPKATLAPRAPRAPRTRALRTRATMPGPTPELQGKTSATNLLAQADALWRTGEKPAARRAFRAAAQERGPIGEAAWVRLARLELQAGSSQRALTALNARKSRAGTGMLGAEAWWLEAQALERAGRSADAVKAAQTLIRDHPSSPQASAGRRLVAKGKAP